MLSNAVASSGAKSERHQASMGAGERSPTSLGELAPPRLTGGAERSSVGHSGLSSQAGQEHGFVGASVAETVRFFSKVMLHVMGQMLW